MKTRDSIDLIIAKRAKEARMGSFALGRRVAQVMNISEHTGYQRVRRSMLSGTWPWDLAVAALESLGYSVDVRKTKGGK